jgi:succinyl-diaminopimelate desuccinylase
MDLLGWAGTRREELVDLCAALVAAPSVNPPGDTRAVASVVAGALAARGLAPRLERAVETMPSVLAGIDSGRPGPHLVLNVHLDTMPPGDRAAWSVPVHRLTRRDGRLYGLGMGNMKGAVAAMIDAAALLHDRRGEWCGRVTVAAVSDEVVFGDNGAAHLLRTHPDLAGDGLICGEGPGFRRLALGEKGVLWLRVTAVARRADADAPGRTDDAWPGVPSAVTRLDALTGRRGTLPPELARVMTGTDDPGLELSVNVGTMTAGTFVGQVAVAGHAEVDLRVPPGMTADDAEAEVRAELDDVPGLRVTRLKGWDPNWTRPDTALARAWRSASLAIGRGEPVPAVRLPASDASRWRRRGVPALCYGPQPTLSAGVDDHADEDEVVACAALYAGAALAFLDPAAVLRREPPVSRHIVG